MAPPCCCARAWMEASVSAAWGLATACRGEYGHGECARWRGAVAMRARHRKGAGGCGARLAPAYAQYVAHDLALVEGVLGARGVLAVDEGDEAAVPRAQPLLLGARPHDLRSRDYSATTSTGSPQATGHMVAPRLLFGWFDFGGTEVFCAVLRRSGGETQPLRTPRAAQCSSDHGCHLRGGAEGVCFVSTP